MQRLIKRVLAEEPGETCAGAQGSGRDAQGQQTEVAMVRIERFVSCIAQKSARDGRQVNVTILRQDERRYEQIRKNRFIKVVADLKTSVVFSVDQTFELKRSISKVGAKKSGFSVVRSTERLVSELHFEPMKRG